MVENRVEADAENPGGITASRAIHCHINDGLMRVWSGTVVAITELEGLQTVLTAIELCT